MNKNDLKSSSEYGVYTIVKLWEPLPDTSLAPLLIYGRAENEFLSSLYHLIKEQNFPLRLDGKEHLIHPLNVAYFLQQAKADFVTVCCGMAHDYVEERVDQYKEKERVSGEGSAKVLDDYEREVCADLERKINSEAMRISLPTSTGATLQDVTTLLTRHKRHLYYRSIAEIFSCKSEEIKERAIQVKLADRLHNVLCLDTFEEKDRMYSCFKNVFILNNAKRYLFGKNQITETDILLPTEENTTEKLFRKCSKATYVALVAIVRHSLAQGIQPAATLIQLFFEKYAFQSRGLGEVTEWEEQAHHPSKLFQAVIRKYDALLHHERDEFERRNEREVDYCQKFFADFYFTPEQIKAITDYKDAYTLRHIVGRLLYQKDYVLVKFDCAKLCERGRKCLERTQINAK